MQVETVLLLILAAFAAGAVGYYQYYFRAKSPGKYRFLMAFFRFLTVFTLLLLLIYPRISRETLRLEKRSFLVATDNSLSLRHTASDEAVLNVLENLRDPALETRFIRRDYQFSGQLQQLDSLSFSGTVTDIQKALRDINSLYDQDEAVLVLISDGNQTYGSDYEFFGSENSIPVYPIVVGDTTQYEDVRIEQVNLNRYAFLKNKFPVETFISYRGNKRVQTPYTIFLDNRRVFSEVLTLSPQDNTKRLTTLLEANSVGNKKIQISLGILDGERNRANNVRNTSIEVLDEQVKVALVTDILHPDIGALKKAIEANEQRSVTILKPLGNEQDWSRYDLFIVYQPNAKFQEVFRYIEAGGASSFTITGTQTAWGFLNTAQTTFEKEYTSLSDEVLPVANPGFSAFDLGPLDFATFPPLESALGEILIAKPHEVILEQRIRGVNLSEPLLAIVQEDVKREALLFGENLWKWRAQSYRNDQSFDAFDQFIGKIIRYLSGNRSKTRLSLDYEKIIDRIENARVRVSFFDQAFQFEENAVITITIKDVEQGTSLERNLLLKNRYYEVDLSDLEPGEYEFTVTVGGENLQSSGSFTLLDYDIEKQLLSSDYRKLDRLAGRTGGALYFPDQLDTLIAELTTNTAYLPRQRSEQNVVSLIDLKLLLATLALSLTIEWFLRKYNGLI